MRGAVGRWLGSMLMLGGGIAHASDLLYYYELALTHDPVYQGEIAASQSTAEAKAQGFAGLLPNVSISANRNNNFNDVSDASFGREAEFRFYGALVSLNVSQPIYRPQSWAIYQAGQAQAEGSQYRLAAAGHDLILKVVQAYLDVLLADKDIGLAQAQQQAISEQLKQASRLFQGGVGTITDVHEAQARSDVLRANLLESINTLEAKRRALQKVSGKYPKSLAHLADRIALEAPDPKALDQVLERALLLNPVIQFRRLLAEAAKFEIDRQRAGHYPSLDLVASRSFSKNPSFAFSNTQNDAYQVGLQLSIPVYQGGFVNSKVRQVEADYRKAQQDLEEAMEQVRLDVRREFQNVINSTEKSEALREAVGSTKQAYVSAQKGFQAGTRTSVDVLNAQQQVVNAERDLHTARLNYLFSKTRLLAAMGELSAEHLAEFSRLYFNTAPSSSGASSP